MRVLSADAMIFWEMDGYISFVSEAGKEKNSGLPEHTDFHPFTFEGLEETVERTAREAGSGIFYN